MLIDNLLILAISFSLSLFLMLLFKIFALKSNLLLRQKIPQIGGIAVALSFAVTVFTAFLSRGSFSWQALGIVVASLIMLAFGVIDDWRESSITTKVVMQLIATSILYAFGIRTHIIYIGVFLNALVTYFWVIGITNAFNHLDVMDGLAAGNAIIATCAFLAVSSFGARSMVGFLLLALLGALAGFIIFNLPPARAYLGNAGSHLLGFILAALALLISYAPMERKIALFAPLLILGFPIFDTLFLILVRLSRKKIPFKKSNDHLVLKFLSLGIPKKKVLFFVLLAAGIFSLCGVLLTRLPNTCGIFIMFGAVLIGFIIARLSWGISVND